MIIPIYEYKDYKNSILPFGLTIDKIVSRLERAGEDFTQEKVKIKDIVISHLTNDSKNIKLLKYHDKYWIVDGSLERSIKDGLKSITADVIDATNSDWLFNTSDRKTSYNLKANETLKTTYNSFTSSI